jgi:hypothetical protein
MLPLSRVAASTTHKADTLHHIGLALAHDAPLRLTLQDRLQVAATRLQVVMVSKGCAAAVIFVCIVLFVVQVLLQLSQWCVWRICWKRAVVGRLQSSISTAAWSCCERAVLACTAFSQVEATPFPGALLLYVNSPSPCHGTDQLLPLLAAASQPVPCCCTTWLSVPPCRDSRKNKLSCPNQNSTVPAGNGECESSRQRWGHAAVLARQLWAWCMQVQTYKPILRIYNTRNGRR